jgi:hypothetical protein
VPHPGAAARAFHHESTSRARSLPRGSQERGRAPAAARWKRTFAQKNRCARNAFTRRASRKTTLAGALFAGMKGHCATLSELPRARRHASGRPPAVVRGAPGQDARAGRSRGDDIPIGCGAGRSWSGSRAAPGSVMVRAGCAGGAGASPAREGRRDRDRQLRREARTTHEASLQGKNVLRSDLLPQPHGYRARVAPASRRTSSTVMLGKA